jgi:hypothetical protein
VVRSAFVVRIFDQPECQAPSLLHIRPAGRTAADGSVPRGYHETFSPGRPSDVDLCGVDPGYEVGLHVRASLRSMTAVWMGHSTLQREIDAGHIELIGDRALARSLHAWLGFSSFAKQKRRVA